MAGISGTRQLKTWVGDYSFATDAGAIGTIILRSSSGAIPIGSYIVEAFMEVTTGFTTGTAATGAITVESANDLQTATIVSGAPYSTTGIKALVPVFTAATMIKVTADRAPSFVIATGTVTAGVFHLVIFYI